MPETMPPPAPTAYEQDVLFCYGDKVTQQEPTRNLVCTMRLVTEQEQFASSLSLFGDDAPAPAAGAAPLKKKAVHNFHLAADVPQLSQVLEGAIDTFMSQSMFDKPVRRVVNFSRTNTSFVDLDYYDPAVSPDQAVRRILDIAESVGLADDQITIMSSGRGYYMKVPLENPADKQSHLEWKRNQVGLINLYAELGADPKCKDATRVLRPVGTVNNKDGARFNGRVETVHQATRRTPQEALALLLDQTGLRAEKASRKARAQRTEYAARMGQAMTAEEASWHPLFAPIRIAKFHERMSEMQAQPRTMNLAATMARKRAEFSWAAMADIDRLATLRGGKFAKGARDATVFWSLVLLVHADLVSAENFWTEAYALAARTVGFYDPRADGSLSTLFEKVCRKGAFNEQGVYIATKERLMDEIAITPDEERSMAVLVSRSENERRIYAAKKEAAKFDGLRANERALLAKMLRVIQREKIAAINECRAERLSDDDLAFKLKVHVKTVRRYRAWTL